MNINVFLVRNSQNEVVFQAAVEDSDTTIQVILPSSMFSKEEKELIESDKTIFSQHAFKDDSDYCNLGELKVHYMIGNKQLPSFTFEMIKKDISYDDFLDNNINYDKAMAVLTAYRKDTNEIIFAEGTDIDGYYYHQMRLPISEFSIADVEYLLNHDGFVEIEGEFIDFKERECKDFFNDELENIHIGKEYFYL